MKHSTKLLIILTFCLVISNSFVTTGAEPADWKAEADKRIEELRKRDISIQILDREGSLIPGAKVRARQIRHHFGFGTAVNGNLITNPTYTAFFKDHFEWAVLENESKWYQNEPDKGYVTYEKADYIYDFCAAHGITVRGHCLFWEVENYNQKWLRDLPEAELRAAIDRRLESAVKHFRGNFVHWDVNNEMMHGKFFRRKLGDEIDPYMFQKARELDPDVKLFVNDYGNIDANETPGYVSHIRDLMKQGAPIDGIGVQGHFSGDIVPKQVYDKLDKLAVFNLPIWVTEFDYVSKDENKRAENLEKLYRTAFSHPMVGGIMMWGFWAGSHWRGADAAIVNLDWTLNAAGKKYLDLMREWTTEFTGTTDENGQVQFRGFHGLYEVTVTLPDGHKIIGTCTLEPGTDVSQVTLNTDDGSMQPPPWPRPVKPWPVPARSETPAKTILVNDNFQSGVKPDEWIFYQLGGRVTISPLPKGSGKCLSFEDYQPDMGTKAVRVFTPQWSKVVVEAKLLLPMARKDYRINIGFSEFTSFRLVTTAEEKIGYYGPNGAFVPVAVYKEGKWFRLKIVADIEKEACDIYVDNKKKATGVAFQTKTTYLDRVEFVINDGEFYVDDVKVSTP